MHRRRYEKVTLLFEKKILPDIPEQINRKQEEKKDYRRQMRRAPKAVARPDASIGAMKGEIEMAAPPDPWPAPKVEDPGTNVAEAFPPVRHLLRALSTALD